MRNLLVSALIAAAVQMTPALALADACDPDVDDCTPPGTHQVPEGSTLSLLAAGLAVCAGLRRKSR